ncbi:MAG TPA: PBP1A family penicillin-binding protein [Syntrophorhabdales bacterium]|nr:PBP1A family penicillin-binding protein [Syntrophorhabdales bacterium]
MSRIIRFAILLFFVPAALGTGFSYSLVNYLELPDVKQLETYKPKSATRLYADDGTLFAELFVEKRIPIPTSEMPKHLRLAFIAIEDVRFYQHMGIDVRGIFRAAYRNVMRQSFSEGASTITQQLARNLFLTPTKSFKRKIEEAILAVNIERTYSKDEILSMYLNLIYLGEGAYGVEAASYTYFHKKTRDLDLQEAATLASLTKSPSRSSPFKNVPKAMERRNLVLRKMYEAGFINKDEYVKAAMAPLALAPFRTYARKNGYFIEYVKQILEEHLSNKEEIYTQGLNVRTSLSLQMTEFANVAIEKGLLSYRERHPKTFELPEMALVAIEVKTGEVKVLIGGKDFTTSPYNRMTQAKRQPGSAFKPIIYLAALEQGLKPDYMLRDAPVSYTNPWTRQVWSPKNYNNEYHGDVPMRRALELSLNAATVRLLEKIGVENVIELAQRLHISSNFEPNLSLALGSTEVMPLELALAYATVARGGVYLPPKAVRSISAVENEVYSDQPTEPDPVVNPEQVSMLIDMMKGVIKRGTAAKAARMPYYLAGKTGTTNDFRDAWFIGFSPNLLCAVWVGYDKETHLAGRESGATAALPIWIDFMSKALTFYPNEDFSPPEKESISQFTPPFGSDR